MSSNSSKKLVIVCLSIIMIYVICMVQLEGYTLTSIKNGNRSVCDGNLHREIALLAVKKGIFKEYRAGMHCIGLCWDRHEAKWVKIKRK